jgi:hypothetical protein
VSRCCFGANDRAAPILLKKSSSGWCEERGARGLASAQAGCNVGSHCRGRRRKRRPEPLAGVNARRFGTSGYSKSTRPTSEMGLCSDRTPVTDGSADSGHFQGLLICPKCTIGDIRSAIIRSRRMLRPGVFRRQVCWPAKKLTCKP